MSPVQRLAESLGNLGLTEYEISAYTALLSGGSNTASEISRASGVPQSRIYDILDLLEKKGFVLIQMGRPTTYIAVQPKKALDKMILKRKTESEDHIRILAEDASSILGTLEDIADKNLKLKRHEDVFKVIEKNDVWIELIEMVKTAEKHLGQPLLRSEALEAPTLSVLAATLGLPTGCRALNRPRNREHDQSAGVVVMEAGKDVLVGALELERVVRLVLGHRVGPARSEVPPVGVVPVRVRTADIVLVDTTITVVVVPFPSE